MHNDGRQYKNRTGKAKSAPTTPYIEQRMSINTKCASSLEKEVMAILHRPASTCTASSGSNPTHGPTVYHASSHHAIAPHSNTSKIKHRSFSNTNRSALKSVSRSTPAIVNEGTWILDSKDGLSHLPRSTRKFHKHFPEVSIGRGVLNYYVCAYVADILHQGTLYITETYFAFYSNIFGFVNKILIPISEVADIKKKKTASFIPNAIGILTDEGKMYVFSSLISRENTYKFMDHMWRKSRRLLDSDSDPAIVLRQEINVDDSNGDEDSASGSGEDSIVEEEEERGGGGGNNVFETRNSVVSTLKLLEVRTTFEGNSLKQQLQKNSHQEKKNYLSNNIKMSSRIAAPQAGSSYSVIDTIRMPIEYLNYGLENSRSANILLWSSTIVVMVLIVSATYMMYRLHILTRQIDGEDPVNYNSVYEEVLYMQQQLHSGTAQEIERTLGAQLKQISTIRQSLESLSYLFNTDYSTRGGGGGGGKVLQENIINAA